MKELSIIILNWNGVDKNLLRQYLPSVVEHTPSDIADIIVADNGSSDASLEVLEAEFPSVKVIAFPRNLGFAEGYNQAIKQVKTPLVLLLNDDVEVTEGWLTPMLEHMEAHKHTAALQPKIKSDRDRTRFEYAGAAGGYLDKHYFPFCRGRIFDTCEVDTGQYDHTTSVMWASGACLLVRRELYLKAGGLDKDFFAHMEEIDLCWRLRRMGYRIACVPHSTVYHLGGGSLQMGDPKKTLLNFRNSLLMIYKNVSKKKRGRVLFMRKIYDGVAALNFLLHGEWQQVRAIARAHKEASMMITDIYEKQEYMQGRTHGGLFGRTRHTDAEKINIVFQYYLLNHKKYQDLDL